jgi:hypothetical protein
MQSLTVATLEALEAASWFSRVGVKDTETAIVLPSWQAAIEHSESYDWEDLRLEALNRYRECVAVRSMERLNVWNDVLREVKRFTEPLVKRKIVAVVRDHDLPEIFYIRVRNDMVTVCMESEYADLCPPGFFTANARWYLNGHFPCGWQGEFPPKGTPVIY